MDWPEGWPSVCLVPKKLKQGVDGRGWLVTTAVLTNGRVTGVVVTGPRSWVRVLLEGWHDRTWKPGGLVPGWCKLELGKLEKRSLSSGFQSF